MEAARARCPDGEDYLVSNALSGRRVLQRATARRVGFRPVNHTRNSNSEE